ncbi:MAG: glycyl-radical enzyme activating protein [Eubacteriales bacterium]|nr:glycyl-radical enzyme activating protein [Eubacteriales bacterium]
MKGMVFDLEEFAVYDGPGIRCAVFLKGCPLRCEWCHNPEGLSPLPQRVVTQSLCAHCGQCRAVCPTPQGCTACGACVPGCPQGCIRIAGQLTEHEEVAARIRRVAPLLAMNGGGVTFTGGEALMQSDFVLAVRRALPDVHACIETCGYAPKEDFLRVCREMDLVILDIKLVDTALHKRYTGADNALILANLEALKASGIPFRVRIPLIPTVNDTQENLEATAKLLTDAPQLEKVELLPYHRAAGGKYASLGMAYRPSFPENIPPRADVEIFAKYGIKAGIL